MENSAQACLRYYFNYQSFRPGQEQIIDTVLSGQQSLVVMPTGGGKSLCYQIPALMLPGITIVVSPLIALMKDQVEALHAKNIPSATLHSNLNSDQIQLVYQQVATEQIKILYVAPERFRSRGFLSLIKRLDISLLAIDEAHCISMWGHDFRPAYLNLKEVIKEIHPQNIIALTATATKEVQNDIIESLELAEPNVFVTGFDRKNLKLLVQHINKEQEKLDELLTIIPKIKGVGIVYVSTRKKVEETAAFLNQHKINAVAYHAGLSPSARNWAQNLFIQEKTQVMVATNAFGMGIDKSNIRFVIHLNLPGTLEAYYQEIGRAGRDGNTAYCVMLPSLKDWHLQEFFIDNAIPSLSCVKAVCKFVFHNRSDFFTANEQFLLDHLTCKTTGGAISTVLRLLIEKGILKFYSEHEAPVQIFPFNKNTKIISELSSLESDIREHLFSFWDGQTERTGLYFDLSQLARNFGLKQSELKQRLLSLHDKNIFNVQFASKHGMYQILERIEKSYQLIDHAGMAKRKKLLLKKLQLMMDYSLKNKCRRVQVLNYFGEKCSFESCNSCDHCLSWRK